MVTNVANAYALVSQWGLERIQLRARGRRQCGSVLGSSVERGDKRVFRVGRVHRRNRSCRRDAPPEALGSKMVGGYASFHTCSARRQRSVQAI